MATPIHVTGASKYVDITGGELLINGEILYVNTNIRITDDQLTGSPIYGGDSVGGFGDYYIFFRANRKVMESYYSKNWEYLIKSVGPGATAPPAAPDEFCIGYVQKRNVSGNTQLTKQSLNLGKRLVGTKDLSDGSVTAAKLDPAISLGGGGLTAPAGITNNQGIVYQTSSGTFIAADLVFTTDSRMTNARTPTSHTHVIPEVTGLQTALDATQPLDGDLSAIAALTSAANKMPYSTGAQAWALADLSVFARTFLDDPDAATFRATIGAAATSHTHAIADVTSLQATLDGKQPLDTDLTAFAALTSAPNKIAYATGAGTWALTDFSAFARTVVDDADASTMLSTLGVTTFVKTILDDVDAPTVRATIAAAALASPTFTGIPAGPTAAVDTNTTQFSTTAFVIGQNYLKAATAATTYQPLDADLTAIAALTTTSYGRSVLAAADAAALRTITGAEAAANKGVANGYAGLDSGGKVPIAQLPSSLMEYQGVWNASTNTPTLIDGTGSAGDVYRVTVAASRNLGSGAVQWDVGDYAVYNGTTWEKSDTTDSVPTVFGRTGNVVAASGDYSVGQVTGAAPLASPSLTGTPLSTTAAVDTNTTQISTTAYVIGQGYLKAALAASTYLTQANAALTYQPLDSDLTAIAALTTTSFGRALLTEASATTVRATLAAAGIGVVNNFTASQNNTGNWNSGYSTYGNSYFTIDDGTGHSITGTANYGGPGTDTYLGFNNPIAVPSTPTGATYALNRTAANLLYQPLDSDLTSIAALSTTTFGRALLTQADAPTTLSTLGVSTFIKTLLDDVDQATALATLGAIGTASPTFTGTVTVPTPTVGGAAANKSYVDGLGLGVNSSDNYSYVAEVQVGGALTVTTQTTVDLSSYVPPGTKYALLTAKVGGTTTSASFVTSSITLKERISGNSRAVGRVAMTTANATGGSGYQGQAVEEGAIKVPLDGSRSFDYVYIYGHNGSPLAQLNLIGYVSGPTTDTSLVAAASAKPAFRAYHTNAAGAYASGATILFGNETHDSENAYNPATGAFVAPKAGVYHFDWQVYSNTVGAANKYWESSLRADGGRIVYGDLNYANGTYQPNSGGSCDLLLKLGESVLIKVDFDNGGTTAILGSGETSFFSGHYVGPDYKGSTVTPKVAAYATATQALTTGSSAFVALPLEKYDSGTLHDTATNNHRLTAPVAGVYQVDGFVEINAAAGGAYRLAGIEVNSVTPFTGASTIVAEQNGPITASGSTRLNVSAQVYLGASEWVSMAVYQDSGGTVNINTNINARLAMHLVPDTVGGLIVPEGWQTLPLYVGTGAPTVYSGYTPQVKKDPFGNVQVRGEITCVGTATGQNLFVLPVGYRPQNRMSFVLQVGQDGTLPAVEVNASGAITIGSRAASTGLALNLAGIQFSTL